MDTYVTRELPRVVAEHFPASDVRGTFGQSMGGYGALTLSLKTPDLYASVSAFAPVSAPMRAPWEKKAFPGYLGADEELWREHDASELVRRRPFADGQTILVDQGTADEFLEEQLYPEVLEVACREAGQPLTLRWHEGYDTQLLHLDVHGGPRAPPRGGPGQHNLARRSSSARGRPSKNSKP